MSELGISICPVCVGKGIVVMGDRIYQCRNPLCHGGRISCCEGDPRTGQFPSKIERGATPDDRRKYNKLLRG